MKKLIGVVLAAAMLLSFALPVLAADVTTELLAGQTNDVGDVKVSDDGTNITVEIVIDPSLDPALEILETHVDLQTDSGDIPQNKNKNPKVGQFAVSEEFDPGDGVVSRTYTFTSPGPGTDVCVAVHVVVADCDYVETDPGSGVYEWVVVTEETAWADGEQFNEGKNWAMYIKYTTEA